MKTLIGANWKMNPGSFTEARDLSRGFTVPESQEVEVVVFPPAVYLRELADAFPHLLWGVQNIYSEPTGAYTGEISTRMVRDAGAHYVLVGHSERRRLFGETDEMVSKKAAAALSKGFRVVLAVGEFEKGTGIDAVVESLKRSTQGLDEGDLSRLTIAYEPVWAISTSKNREDATPGYVEEIIGILKDKLDVRYIYGGSVKGQNAADFLRARDVSGALVGGASLKADEFNVIIKQAGSLDS